MLLNDTQIERLCANQNMVMPFVGSQQTQIGKEKIVSKGLSSVGYDISLGSRIRVYQPYFRSAVIDPAKFDDRLLTEFEVDDHFDLPAHGYALGVSVERFEMPDNVAGLCLTKSTYARCGLFCNTTPLEPGWVGYLTLELSNLTDLPIRVYVGQGIAQILFFQVDRPRVSYGDRQGKYQNQESFPVPPRMR